jgi:cation-transporting ATPase E
MAALRGFFTGEIHQQAIAAMPFTSAKKYGGVSFHEDETYVLGAPDVMLGERYGAYAELIDGYAAKGCRVLLLADYSGQLSDEKLTGALLPLALILLNNKIRAEAPDTFRYFAAQGVAVKVISGDNPLTVSEVAKRAGIEGAERCVDARTLTDDALLEEAAGKYTVFGRVTPAQKRKLVQALKRQKHIVAMTGDGVNDVLALKEADCSVAMASGSDAACHVSNIVLLNSDFSAMPGVVAEGRRVINNIERSATLFLVKNIFSFTLAIVSLIFTMPYPFSAAQLSLVSSLTIGFPAFVLAMEPNESLISGRFLRNVLSRALPAAMTDFVLIIGIMLFYYAFKLPQDMMSTICAVTMGIVGIFVIIRLCKPFTFLRKLLVAAVCIAFAFSAIFLKRLFTLSPLDFPGMLLLVVFALLAWPALNVAYKLQARMEKSLKAKPKTADKT